MKSFIDMGLPEPLLHAMHSKGFLEPTPIQAKAIPIAMQGKDLLGSAQTGTGKTLAFGVPAVSKVMSNDRSIALIVTPTRELATQVVKSIREILPKKTKINLSVLIGGESIGKQLSALKQKPRIIVGTPGRINDHLKRKSLKLSNADFFVLDETDRMLDMGFSVQIDEIVKTLPEERQTLLFSATLPNNIIRVAKKYLNNPERVSVGDGVSISKNLEQKIVYLNEGNKYQSLVGELQGRDSQIIIFMKTKHSADKMALKLKKENYLADAIHGDLRHQKRDRVIKGFRNGKSKILVATDIAARGLDIPEVGFVINYDLPQCPEDYIHRVGRTARAGRSGSSVCFIAPHDNSKWREITKLIGHVEGTKQEKNDNFKGKSKKSNEKSKSSSFKKNKKRSDWSGKESSEGFEGRSKRSNENFKSSSFKNNKKKSDWFGKEDSEGFEGRSRRSNKSSKPSSFKGNKKRSDWFGKEDSEGFEGRPRRSNKNNSKPSSFKSNKKRSDWSGKESREDFEGRPKKSNEKSRSGSFNKNNKRKNRRFAKAA